MARRWSSTSHRPATGSPSRISAAISGPIYYFRNSWQRGPDSVRQALAALARGEVPELGRSARRWLCRRELIDDQDRLTIPVLGRFLIEAELA